MTHPTPAIAIPDLQIDAEVGRGAHTVVHRARRGDRTVAVKVASADPGPGDAAARFRREAGLLASVRHPALPAVLEVGEAEGRAYLVLEYVDGVSLARRTAEAPLAEPEAIELARTLAGALAELHRHGLVHRDVKPENVVLDGAGRAYLVDLGLATQWATTADGAFAGSLLYSAPEQTGVLRRPIDGRADLYALGCVLFECLAGRPPFDASDAGDVLQQQATARAPDLASLGVAVSPVFAAVVARLLAKDPDDRYQSASGLLADLAQVDSLNALAAAGAPIALGQHDGTPDVPEELRLVGREAELRALQDAWTAALDGRPQLRLVEGDPGAGKSRLARELLRHVRGRGGLALVARGSPDSRAPLGAVREAIEGWLRRVPEPERAEVAAIVREAAGELAPLLRRLTPTLRATLSDDVVPATGAGGPRFLDAVAELLRGVARARGGAVLLVEDGQWLDDSSRAVVRRLAAPTADAPLLVVVTLRADAEGHAAADALTDGVDGAALARIELAPLDEAAVGQLVAQHLGGQPPSPRVVAQIAARADGNALLVAELVRAMLEAGSLRPYWGTWRSTDRALDDLALPDDVMALLVRRVERLSAPAQRVLASAAVVGARFSADLVRAVCGEEAEAVGSALVEATAVELIERTQRGFGFVHDRIRVALLSRLDEAARRALHQRVADALAERAEQDVEWVYARAQHLARGEVQRDPATARAANVAAGVAAVASFADAEAFGFLDDAAAIGERYGLPPDVDLLTQLGDVCARLGRWTRAIAEYERALAIDDDPLRRGQIGTRLARALVANRDGQRAWEVAQAAFRDLGVAPPNRGLASRLVSLAQALGGLLMVTTGLGYGRAAGRERERLAGLAQLFETAGFIGYQLSDRRMVGQAVVRSLPVAARLGPGRELAVALTGVGMAMGLFGRPRLALGAVDAAMRVATVSGDRVAVGRAAVGAGWTQHVLGRPRAAAELSRRCVDAHGQWLDAHNYWVACSDLAWNLAMRGYTQEAARWLERASQRAEASSRQNASFGATTAALRAVHGDRAEARRGLAEALRVADETPDERWRAADALGWGLLVHLELGDFGPSLEDAIRRHRAIGFGPKHSSFHGRHFYVFQAHARLAQCMAEVVSDGDHVAELAAAVAELRRCGGHPTFRAHHMLLVGALSRLRGEQRGARRALAAAERLADEIDAPWVLFEVARQRAHLLVAAGDRPAALRCAHAALGLANQHGWPNRAAWVRAEFGLDVSSGTRTHGTRVADPRTARPLRHLEALQAVALATATVLDPDEQARVALDEVVRVMGAERAFLFLSDETGELRFKAGRDAAGADLPELRGYSRTVLDTVALRRQPVLLSGAAEGELATAASIVAHDIRSIAAAPLLLRERLVGVLYLDNRLARGVFGEEDLAVLTAIGGQIAIAAETAAAFAAQTALAEANAELLRTVQAQVGELRRSRGRITAAEERLRREIGEMLHSRVQSRLLVAWHRLGQGIKLVTEEPERAVALLREVRDDLDQIREREIRRASHQLHPAVIRVGLAPALRSLANSFEERVPVEVRVDPAVLTLDDPADNKIDEALRLTAYRAVEEALGNVARHAEANEVVIEVSLDGGETLVVQVRDDGRGFDPSRRLDGLGLTSIATRVEAAGGQWDVASAPGAGTTVLIRLPLAASNADEAAG